MKLDEKDTQVPPSFTQLSIDAKAQFPSSIEAIITLCDMNVPTSLELSSPSKIVRKALLLIASFTTVVEVANVIDTASQVRKHWTSISEWATFFMEQVVLTDEEPRTETGVQLRDNTLHLLPFLLQGYSDTVADGQELYRLTPNLYFLTAKGWFRIIEKRHPSWVYWAILSNFEIKAFDKKDFWNALGTYYLSEERVARVCTNHINYITQQIRFGNLRNLFGVIAYLQLLYPDIKTPFVFNSRATRGIYEQTRLLFALVSPTTLRYCCSSSKAFEDVTSAIVLASSILFRCLSTAMAPLFVCEALDGGLVSIIFKARWFYNYSPGSTHQLKLGPIFSQILRLISHFMIHPSVLQRARGSVKKIVRSGVEDEWKPRPEDFWHSWEVFKEEADNLGMIYRDIKVQPTSGFDLCANSPCPYRSKRPSDVRFLRCSECATVTYCSRECAKTHWRTDHRRVCKTYAKLHQAKKDRPANNIETAFWHEVVQQFLTAWEDDIRKEVTTFSARKRILVFDLYKVYDPPLTPPFRFVQLETLIRYPERWSLNQEIIVDVVRTKRAAHREEWVSLIVVPGAAGGVTWQVECIE